MPPPFFSLLGTGRGSGRGAILAMRKFLQLYLGRKRGETSKEEFLGLSRMLHIRRRKNLRKARPAIYSNSLLLKTNHAAASLLHQSIQKSAVKPLPRIEDSGDENFPDRQNGKLLTP